VTGVLGSGDRFERIHDLRTEPSHVLLVASRKSQAMYLGRRGQQAVNHREGARCAHSPPLVRHSPVDGQYARAERVFNELQPLPEASGFRRVGSPRELNASSDLAEDQNAQEEIGVPDGSVPGSDPAVAAFALANLRYDVGVEQEHPVA
jgi:hypothetical protein